MVIVELDYDPITVLIPCTAIDTWFFKFFVGLQVLALWLPGSVADLVSNVNANKHSSRLCIGMPLLNPQLSKVPIHPDCWIPFSVLIFEHSSAIQQSATSQSVALRSRDCWESRISHLAFSPPCPPLQQPSSRCNWPTQQHQEQLLITYSSVECFLSSVSSFSEQVS